MRVSDVVQHADLSLWAELALVLFLGSFVIVAIRALRTDKAETKSMAGIVFDGDDDMLDDGGVR